MRARMRPDRPTTARPRARGRQRDGGAVIVETAIALMVLVPLVFGTLEFGMAWRSAHETVGAARAGARVAAGLGEDWKSDYMALSSIKASLTAVGLEDDLRRVIIYEVPNDRTSTHDGTPPTTCTETAPTGACNVYTGAQVLSLVEGDFSASTGCTSSTSKSLLRGYCSVTQRDADQRTADYLAVQVVIEGGSVTGMFPSRTVRRHAAMRMEPATTGGGP